MTDPTPEPTPVVASVETPEAVSTPRFGLLSIVVAALFGLLYVYDLWEAISNLVELPVLYAALGLDGVGLPWGPLILGVALPPVVFGLALLVGRRRTVGVQSLLFVLGLANVAGASLGIIAFEFALRPTI
jgi:hypothetical protein